jgi:hypothetical protein
MKRRTTMASLGMAAVLGFGLSATAQHPGAKKPPAGNPAQRGPMNGGRAPVPPQNTMEAQFQAHLQQMMIQEQLKMQQRQMQLLQHQQQQQLENHQRAMSAFNAWQQQQGKSSGSANIPSTPAAFQKWAHTQQQKKAHKQSYDPAYDDYQQYQAGQKTAKSAAQTAQAQKKAAAKAHAATAAAKPVPTTASARLPLAQDQPMIGMLRTIHAELDRADATYDGNRFAAMGHIHNALRHLGSSGLSPGDSDNGAGHMPQSESDAILKGASASLGRVATQLSSAGAEHHSRALHEVHEAIRRLHTALQIN